MNEKYLPIGTVVTLNEATKKVMILGYFPMGENNTVFDYNACLYPEGVIYQDKSLAFNHSDIKEVNHMGYESEEHKSFNEQLKKMIEGLNDIKNMNLPEDSSQNSNIQNKDSNNEEEFQMQDLTNDTTTEA